MAGVGMVALPLQGPINGLGLLGFAAAGLAGGGVAGALVDQGLSPDAGHYVEHWLEQGHVVILVECRDRAEEAIARSQFELQGIDNIQVADGEQE
jgi:hypothetical protein